MPAEGPGRRFSVVATKATEHNKPAVELNHAGVAAKSAQPAPAAVSQANADAAKKIAIGEEFVIMLDGVHDIASSLLPGGAKAGDRLFIKKSDNSLVAAAEGAKENEPVEAGTHVKFGLLDSIDTVAGLAKINLTQRSSF